MFKFLRKYSVWILGFGGTLLLIAFLAPNVIQQLAQEAGYAGTTQATVGDGESVGFEEWQQTISESQIIDRLGTAIPGVGELESPEHWYLLAREADLAGLTPAVQAVGIDDQTLFNIAGNTGSRPQVVLEALAHLQGIQRLVRAYQMSGKFSERRLNNAASDLLSTVAAETVVIPATPQDNGSFSEEDLQAQLTAWENTPRGEGDQGFGYKLPNRFKVEWLQIPADTIKEATKVSDSFSSREQRKYWRRNETDPRFPAIGNDGNIPEVVSNAYLDELTTKTRAKISRAASDKLRNPRRGLDENNGFYVLPDDWDDSKLDFESLSAALQDEFSLALPEYGSVATWTQTSNANSIPVIGSVLATNLGSTPLDFETLISSAKEFDTNGLYRIQTGVSSPILETASGDIVVFRITQSDPARAPKDLDEVREDVTYDLGRIARWKTLQAESNLIEEFAREKGMLAASIEYGTTVNPPQPVSMVDTGVPTILDPATARPLMSQAIMQRLGAGGRISDMNTRVPSLAKNDPTVIQSIIDQASDLPLETPVASLSAEDRIFIVSSPENMALVLVRVTGTTPASGELATDFSGGTSPILQTMLSVDELGGADAISDAFSFETLAIRHNFERGRRGSDAVEDDVTVNEVN
ncbi:MAG: hypothetical protein H8E86_03815 [Planctomycetes bacterium]|nr:hypothetical protein [Planctomycetota bacterium]